MKEDYDIDFGNFEIDDIDLDLFDVGEIQNANIHICKPKLSLIKSSKVIYDNAIKLAKELFLDFGQRADVIVSGNFIFGDFVEAYLRTWKVKCKEMIISTLSLSQENIDSLKNLIDFGYIDKLKILVSAYFYGHEHNNLIKYIQKTIPDCELGVAGIHTKTIQFHTAGGRKMVLHGSSNLRSSGNIEQFTIEENPELYDFYKELFDKIIVECGLSNIKRGKDLFNLIIQ